jgi:hypothetical protein
MSEKSRQLPTSLLPGGRASVSNRGSNSNIRAKRFSIERKWTSSRRSPVKATPYCLDQKR